jgi:hypothetical protein
MGAAEDGRAPTEELACIRQGASVRQYLRTTPTSLASYHTTEPTLAIH